MRSTLKESMGWISAIVVLLAGCIGEEGVTSQPRDSIADPVTVSRADLSEVFRVGSVSSGTASDFGRIISVAVDRSGRAYVADGQAKQIVVTDPFGNVEEVLGQAGAGPGEFSMISWVAVSPSDDVWVMDPIKRRLTIFAQGTRDVVTVSYPASGHSTSIPWRARLHDDTTLSVVETRLTEGSSQATILRYRLREESLIPMAEVRLSPITRPENIVEERGGIRMRSAPPLSPVVDVLPSDFGSWRVHVPDVRVERLDAVGQVERVVGVAIAGVALPRRVRDSIAASLSLGIERVPETIPPIISLDADEYGRVWVGVTEDGATVSQWYVYDDLGGRWEAGIPPEGLRFLPGQIAIRGRRLVGVIEDSLGVQSVVALQIPVEGREGR